MQVREIESTHVLVPACVLVRLCGHLVAFLFISACDVKFVCMVKQACKCVRLLEREKGIE